MPGDATRGFSGRWVLDQQQSDTLDAYYKLQDVGSILRKQACVVVPYISIVCNDEQLVIEANTPSGPSREVYLLDGREHKTQTAAGPTVFRSTIGRASNKQIQIIHCQKSNAKRRSIITRCLAEVNTLTVSYTITGTAAGGVGEREGDGVLVNCGQVWTRASAQQENQHSFKMRGEGKAASGGGGSKNSKLQNVPKVRLKAKIPWVPDKKRPNCHSCERPFGMLRRRHHCRLCGDVFCEECSTERVQVTNSDPKLVRACGPCFQLVKQETAAKKKEKREKGTKVKAKKSKRKVRPDGFKNVLDKAASSSPPSGSSTTSQLASLSPAVTVSFGGWFSQEMLLATIVCLLVVIIGVCVGGGAGMTTYTTLVLATFMFVPAVLYKNKS